MSKNELEDLGDEFKKWNPMQEDFLNSKFNLYDSGPGSTLDTELQPSELAKQEVNLKKMQKLHPYLVFKNLPKGMSEKSIKNLCSKYASVKDAHYSGKNQWVFIYFKNIADMEIILRAFSRNEYGFKVLVGKHYQGQSTNKEASDFANSGTGGNSSCSSAAPGSGIDMKNRKILPFTEDLARPKVSENNTLDLEKIGNIIAKDDPLRYSLQEYDAHDLERAGVEVQKEVKKVDDEYEYRTGRAFLKLPDNISKFMKEAHLKSDGKYEAEENVYRTNMKSGKENLANVLKCIVCEKPADGCCYRCRPKMYIYCNEECQRADWEEHRQICGRKVDPEKARAQKKTELSVNDNLNDIPNTPDTNSQVKSDQVVKAKKSPESISPNSSQSESFTSTSFPKPVMPPSGFNIPDTNSQVKSDLTVKAIKSPGSIASNSSQSDSFTSASFPKPIMPPSGSSVVMTSVSKTNLVFIRLKTRKADIMFFEIASKIQVAAQKLKPLTTLPRIGKAVIAKFQNSNEFGRALVLKAENANSIKINFFDYGNIETQILSNLYRVRREFIELPRFAVPVILKNVPNYYMKNDVRSLMYSYLRDVELKIKYDTESDLVSPNNVYQVDLYAESTNLHLNSTISALCKPIEPKMDDALLTAQDLEIMPIPVGKDLTFYVMDNSLLKIGCLSCTTKEFALEIEKFSEDIQRYANSLKVQKYAPREGELCIAKYNYDGLWYRGRCEEKVGDGHPSIAFIDYGNISLVNVSDIRPYPPQFSWPIYTVDFGIKGLPTQVDDKVVRRLEELIPRCFPIRFDLVEKISDDFYEITLNSVIESLKLEGLLE